MKVSKLLLICMCCLIAAPSAWGQAANSHAKQGILGYLDPHTGAFRPFVRAEEAVEPPALTTFTGTITVTITITLKTAGITNVNCEISTGTSDGSVSTGFRSLGEGTLVAATGTGTTRTCKATINYAWGLATQSSDMMTTSYIVTGAGSSTGAPPTRDSDLSPLDTRKVPASGTMTALTATVTL
jgi:hypothetical protein